jgi:hypothetical protein
MIKLAVLSYLVISGSKTGSLNTLYTSVYILFFSVCTKFPQGIMYILIKIKECAADPIDMNLQTYTAQGRQQASRVK